MLDLGWYYSERKQQFQMAKIPLKDRATHMYVIGASGSGKTKFLEFPIQQDIKQGNGFCIIDPHGDLVEETRGFLACYYHETQNESIFDRVIIVDPTDPTYTVGFNVLEIPRGLLPLNRRKS
jgi:DNA helicase HerA-like ATPase